MTVTQHPHVMLLVIAAAWLLPWLLPALLLGGCRRKAAFYWPGVILTYLCVKFVGPLLWMGWLGLGSGHTLLSSPDRAQIEADVRLLFDSDLLGGSLAAGALLAFIALLGLRRRLNRTTPRPA